MKKGVLVLLGVAILTLTLFTGVYAEGNVLEMPQIKIVINGETKTFGDVPIVTNNRTLLPLRQLLVNLGVPNDDQHIIWNQYDQSVTVRSNGTEIYLKLYDDKARVNGNVVTLDVASTAYKNRTYIPVRFVSEVLNKKVLWDGNLTTVYIMGEDKYKELKTVLNALRDSSRNVKDISYTINYDVSLQGAVSRKCTGTESVQDDFSTGVTYYRTDTPVENGLSEIYITPNKKYMKAKGYRWMKIDTYGVKASMPEIGLLGNPGRLMGDAQYTGLRIEKTTQSEVVLKGEAYFENIFEKIQCCDPIFFEVGKNLQIKLFETTLYIDRQTNRLKKIEAKIAADTTPYASAKLSVAAQVKYEISAYDSGLDLTVPAAIVNGAYEIIE